MSLYGGGDYMSGYIQTPDRYLKRLMHATDVHFDLLGVTLTIDGRLALHPAGSPDPLHTLVGEAEANWSSERVRKWRRSEDRADEPGILMLIFVASVIERRGPHL